jgi:hypothetical protein
MMVFAVLVGFLASMLAVRNSSVAAFSLTTQNPVNSWAASWPVCTPAQLLGNPGFESGRTTWTDTSTGASNPITNNAGQAAHGGSWKAWIVGYGATNTDAVYQQKAIPTGCAASFTFWLHIDTDETGGTAYDTLAVQVRNSANTSTLATLATYSNVNAASGYQQKTFSLTAYAGQTVTLRFLGNEDSSRETNFVVDDTAVNTS